MDGVAFELIIPSLPGYGWSEGSHRPGLNLIHVARIFGKLMTRVGHEFFYYHGGDWGNAIGKAIGTLEPNRVQGLHLNGAVAKVTLYSAAKIAIGSILPSFVYTQDEDYATLHPISGKITFLLREMGYLHLQATKPDTIGAALSDSPTGLAAYIIEKFSSWTNKTYIDLPDGGITQKFSLDDLLTNVMVYWTTNTITSSQRFYKENLGKFLHHRSF